jgi:hypothetical protein
VSWAEVFGKWWLPMAEVLHYTRDDILALTLDDFLQAVTYTEGRLSNAGQRQG